MEGALAELDSASALLERQSVRGPRLIGKMKFEGMRLIFIPDRDQGIDNTFQSSGGT